MSPPMRKFFGLEGKSGFAFLEGLVSLAGVFDFFTILKGASDAMYTKDDQNSAGGYGA